MEELLTTKEVAAKLKLSESRVKEMVAEGTIPSFRIGGARRFRPADIDAWLKQCEAASVQAPE